MFLIIEKLITPTFVLIFAIFSVFLFRKEISEFIREIGWLKTKWFEMRRIRDEIFAKAKEVKELSEELNQDKKELQKATKTFIESFYLALATRNQFPPPSHITNIILGNLDTLAELAIPNKDDREKWVKKIQELLKSQS